MNNVDNFSNKKIELIIVYEHVYDYSSIPAPVLHDNIHGIWI